jgi:ABC-type multidrug transport system ATPase subunit
MSYWKKFGSQYTALMRKNVLLGVRNWQASVIQLLASVVFLLCLLIIDVADNATSTSTLRKNITAYDPVSITGIPSCTTDMYVKDPDTCYDLVYTPTGNATVEALVAKIKANNPGRVIPDSRVRGFATPDDADDYMLNNHDQVTAAVNFDVGQPAGGSSVTPVNFVIQTNSTVKQWRGKWQDQNTFARLPLLTSVARELIRTEIETTSGAATAAAFEADIAITDFPHPSQETTDLVAVLIGLFVFLAALFGFVLQISEVVAEKEHHLRQALRTMGMLDSVFWLSWMTYHTMFNFCSALFLCVFGVICRFGIFMRNDFGIMLLIIWIFMQAMTGMAYFIAAFCRKTEQGTLIGFMLTLVGIIFQIVVAFGIPYTPDYYSFGGYSITILFSIMPWNPLAKILTDFSAAATDPYDGIKSFEHASKYCLNYNDASVADLPAECTLNDASNYTNCKCVYGIGAYFGNLIALWVGYTLLGIYLDQVRANESGAKQKPYFFFLPSYWSPKADTGVPTSLASIETSPDQGASCHCKDEDVVAAFDETRTRLVEVQKGSPLESSVNAVEIFNLRRTFKTKARGIFEAVKGSWFSIERGELFCLLGPNGAGKSTTINMLTGVLPPSAGDATIYGERILSPGGMDRIRAQMGVCPQFDILWDRLSGLEHMEIYAKMKGLSKDYVKTHAADLLEAVQLTSAAHLVTSGYSGGMKRRLSVAIALLGNPKVVYLDEPTTGMDPVSRRHVWDIIEQAKRDRAIVLTTHSMEEADILGDRIAIMARGVVRCIGSSIRLKKRFGTGYQIAVMVSGDGGKMSYGDLSKAASDDIEAKRAKIMKLFKESLNAEPFDDTGTYLAFGISQERQKDMVRILEQLEKQKEALGLRDIQLSMTSLEEVFLAISRQAEIEASEGKTIPFTMRDGRKIEVPVGAELLDIEGVLYKVLWAQDEDGGLVINDVKEAAGRSGNGRPKTPVTDGSPEVSSDEVS